MDNDDALRMHGLSQGEAQERHKSRLRALKSACPTAAKSVSRAAKQTAADGASRHRRQIMRQRQRDWLRASVASPASKGLSSPGSKDGVGAVVEFGDKSGALAELDDGQSLARARLKLQVGELRAAEAYRNSHKEQLLRTLLQATAHQARFICYPSSVARDASVSRLGSKGSWLLA